MINSKAAREIRFALNLAVTERGYFKSGPVEYAKSQRDSNWWIRKYVPRKYRKLAHRVLERERNRMKAMTDG